MFATNERRCVVAMVGDGVNDAPVGVHLYILQNIVNPPLGIDCCRHWDCHWIR